jgi:hypothetical protein
MPFALIVCRISPAGMGALLCLIQFAGTLSNSLAHLKLMMDTHSPCDLVPNHELEERIF